MTTFPESELFEQLLNPPARIEHTVGCAFGGGRSDEAPDAAAMTAQMKETDIISTDVIPYLDAPEIPMDKTVAEMHKISAWLRR